MSPIAFAIPVFLVLIAIEWWASRRMGRQVYRFNDSLSSLNIGILSESSKALGAGLSVAVYALVQERYGAFEWDTRNPLTWITALLIYDFCYYWLHRANHEVHFLWASHIVHHSSEDFNLATALRQSSTGFLVRWVFYIPMAMLGIPVQVFVVVGLIDLLYQYWVHTELIGRLGWLEYVLVTPSNHRVHHGQNDYCLDRNHGGILCIWDRLFGTYADEREDEKPVYGVRKPLENWNPVWANLHQYGHLLQQLAQPGSLIRRVRVLMDKPAFTSPEGRDFSPATHQRYDTPLAPASRRMQLAGTVLALLALMVYYAWSPQASPVARMGYALAMVVGLGVLGHLMNRQGQQGLRALPVGV